MLLCVGDLYEELLVRLSEAPVRGCETTVRSARVRGGSAANVAGISAELGSDVRFVGQTGDDTIGRTLADDLSSRGVDAMVHHAGGTGVAVTMVGEGSRSRLVDRGASRRLHSIHPEMLNGVTHLYLAASAFTDDPMAAAIERLMGEVRDRQIQLTLGGPSSSDLKSLGVEAFLELVRTTRPDTIVLNDSEHRALGLPPRQAVVGADNTVVTAGRRPAVVIPRHSDAVSVEVRPVGHVRDLTGAGDGFIAGYISSRSTGADAVSATHAAHRVAERVLANLGPTSTG